MGQNVFQQVGVDGIRLKFFCAVSGHGCIIQAVISKTG